MNTNKNNLVDKYQIWLKNADNFQLELKDINVQVFKPEHFEEQLVSSDGSQNNSLNFSLELEKLFASGAKTVQADSLDVDDLSKTHCVTYEYAKKFLCIGLSNNNPVFFNVDDGAMWVLILVNQCMFCLNNNILDIPNCN